MSDITSPDDDFEQIRDAIINLYGRILHNPGIDEINTCAKHLGMWHNKRVAFNNTLEETLLMDYRIFSYRPSGFNMAEKYLRLNRHSLNGADEFLLEKMSEGYYAIYRVEELRGAGIITVSNVFDDAKFTLLDYGVERIFKVGATLASHIIDFGEFAIQSGPILPFSQKLTLDSGVINALGPVYYDHHNLHRINPDNTAKLARALISAAVRLGYTGIIH